MKDDTRARTARTYHMSGDGSTLVTGPDVAHHSDRDRQHQVVMSTRAGIVGRPPRQTTCAESFNSSCSSSASDKAAAIFNSSVCKALTKSPWAMAAVAGSVAACGRNLRARQRGIRIDLECDGDQRQDENDGHGSHGRVFNSMSF
jgi:hypothetical protein